LDQNVKLIGYNSHNAEFEYQVKVVSEQHTVELASCFNKELLNGIISATQNWNIKTNEVSCF
jgi:hypothetical protein